MDEAVDKMKHREGEHKWYGDETPGTWLLTSKLMCVSSAWPCVHTSYISSKASTWFPGSIKESPQEPSVKLEWDWEAKWVPGAHFPLQRWNVYFCFLFHTFNLTFLSWQSHLKLYSKIVTPGRCYYLCCSFWSQQTRASVWRSRARVRCQSSGPAPKSPGSGTPTSMTCHPGKIVFYL